MRVAGIDIWRGRWLAVALENQRYTSAVVSPRIDDLLTAFADVDVIGVDMPIGLTSGTERRTADTVARRFVGRRGSSVFPTYPLDVYRAVDYSTARARCRELTGGSLSRQAYALKDRLIEVNAATSHRTDLREVHPEVSFRAMAGASLAWAKTSWNGFHERLRLLEKQGVRLPRQIADISDAGADDLLDAAAVAWSAARIARGEAQSFPEPPQLIAGREVAIWY